MAYVFDLGDAARTDFTRPGLYASFLRRAADVLVEHLLPEKNVEAHVTPLQNGVGTRRRDSYGEDEDHCGWNHYPARNAHDRKTVSEATRLPALLDQCLGMPFLIDAR